jgi:hypothetical protein
VYGTSSHNGIFGETSSQVDHEGGVVGKNNGKGKGVLGLGTNGEGVKGESANGFTGVYGTSSHNGVFGETKNDNDSGVIGRNFGKGFGVFGVSDNGNGVKGVSQNGFAGFFQGQVIVTGELTVQGVRLSDLVRRLAALEQQVKPAPSPTKPTIRVSSQGSGSGSVFTVTGSGFSANKTVTIRVRDDRATGFDFQQTSAQDGSLNARSSVSCTTGATLHFSATDGRSDPGDLTGVLWSNTFNINCP